MQRQGASNVQTIKHNNKALILDCIRRQPKSRIAISHEIHLAKSAVTRITNDLIRKGLIHEIGTSDTAAGRKPVFLDIVEDAGFAVGLVLHREILRICVSDLKCNILFVKHEYKSQFAKTEHVIEWIYDVIDSIFSCPDFPIEKCIGIGIGCPGPLDYRKGVILVPPELGLFHNLPIVEQLKDRYSLPVMLENIAVLLGLAEYSNGAIKNYHNSLCVTVKDGIGSVILQDGQIYRGFSGLAGEIGHISINYEGPPCNCGGHGCLEKYARLKALTTRFGFESYETVMDDAINNEPYALKIIDYLADRFSCALVNAVNFFDLDSIVISGEYNYKPSLLLDLISRYIEEHSLICRVHKVAIMPSQLGETANEIASVSAILQAFFNSGAPIGSNNIV